jgi:peroxiredoxin
MLSGERLPLARVLGGRVTLASFWAPWCEACAKEVESLNRLAAGAAGRPDALVIGVAVGEPHDKIDVFVREHGVRYAQVIDEDFRLADALGERDVPRTLVIDRAGRVVYRGNALDSEGLKAFRETLGEQEPRVSSR